MSDELSPEHVARIDETADAEFYAVPRLVHHLDEPARAALAAYYGRLLPPGGDVLDLMSSWVSHLPDGVAYRTVVGLGMNAVELEANPRLTLGVVHDLNAVPTLPFADAAFDGCILTASIQYLVRPVEVFADLARALRPGAPCAVAFSNRLFPTKAIALWRALGDADHARLVGYYLSRAGGFAAVRFEDLTPAPGASDPVYVVAATAAAQ